MSPEGPAARPAGPKRRDAGAGIQIETGVETQFAMTIENSTIAFNAATGTSGWCQQHHHRLAAAAAGRHDRRRSDAGALDDNGGPTATHALMAASPAIDAGNNLGGFVFDQRGTGYARIVGARADIGAFEIQPADQLFADGFDP